MVDISEAYTIYNPTLEAVDVALERESPAKYGSVSAGNIADECWRKLWFMERWLKKSKFKAKTLKIFSDGHAQEDIMAERLKTVDGVQLWTEDPNDSTKQINFSLWGGHFRGFLDGIAKGLLEAPKTPHVWDHKAVNQKNFNKLKKLLENNDEKEVLKLWNINYYGQAQIYMYELKLKRHYMTVSTPGGRECISFRTNLHTKIAKQYLKKAEAIIFDDKPPVRISEKADFYQCKWCDYQDICHNTKPLTSLNIPANCRNCAHVTAKKSGGWECECVHSERGLMMKRAEQEQPCEQHIFNPKIFENNYVYTVTQSLADENCFEITYADKRDLKTFFVNRTGEKLFQIGEFSNEN